MSTEGTAARLAQRLGVVRERARLSRRALARMADVSHTYIGRLEAGEIAKPGGPQLDRVAIALGWTDYHALLASDDLEPPTERAPAPDRPTAEQDRLWQQTILRQMEVLEAMVRELVQSQRARVAADMQLYETRLQRGEPAGLTR